MTQLAAAISNLVEARKTCLRTGNTEWKARHEENLLKLVREAMPSGAGFDRGTTIDVIASGPQRLVFDTAFHHMDEHGGYDGWTEHTVIAEPVFGSVAIDVLGENRNDIKDYIHEVFHHALTSEVP